MERLHPFDAEAKDRITARVVRAHYDENPACLYIVFQEDDLLEGYQLLLEEDQMSGDFLGLEPGDPVELHFGRDRMVTHVTRL
jgi:hypothetical protein